MVQRVSCIFIEHAIHVILLQDFPPADLLKRVFRFE